jgi:Fe-Mn family superoxide dismutase
LREKGDELPTRREVLEGAAIVAGALVAPRWSGAAVAEAPAAPPFSLPPLPYAADALEPYLDAETMRLHHDKHHAAYVAKLNEAVAATPAIAGWSLDRLLGDLAAVPESARAAVRNHGGGHANHSLFWTALAPPRGEGTKVLPEGAFASAVAAEFGSLAKLEEALTRSALGVFGSGWAWLTRGGDGKLAIEATPNQDTPLSAGRRPLFGVDVWEHAYYLKYQNRRVDYLAALFQIVDWSAVAGRFA